MSSNKNFFESPQAAAVYEHKLIKSYIPAWVGNVGSTSTDKRVVAYDAYSGLDGMRTTSPVPRNCRWIPPTPWPTCGRYSRCSARRRFSTGPGRTSYVDES